MRKPPTGEPCAGKPHARFGGRGGLKSFPTPISRGAECVAGLIPQIADSQRVTKDMGPRLREDDGQRALREDDIRNGV